MGCSSGNRRSTALAVLICFRAARSLSRKPVIRASRSWCREATDLGQRVSRQWRAALPALRTLLRMLRLLCVRHLLHYLKRLSWLSIVTAFSGIGVLLIVDVASPHEGPHPPDMA